MVVAMANDVTPTIQWGRVLAHHSKIVDDGGVISVRRQVLTATRFPTLRKRSTGAIARNTSVVMAAAILRSVVMWFHRCAGARKSP